MNANGPGWRGSFGALRLAAVRPCLRAATAGTLFFLMINFPFFLLQASLRDAGKFQEHAAGIAEENSDRIAGAVENGQAPTHSWSEWEFVQEDGVKTRFPRVLETKRCAAGPPSAGPMQPVAFFVPELVQFPHSPDFYR